MTFNAPQNETQHQVLQWKNGDPTAFDWLYNRYYKKLHIFICSIVKSRMASEELVQDVFLKIWNKRDLIDESQSFDAYLFKIAKNHALNHIRKKSVCIVELTEGLKVSVSSPNPEHFFSTDLEMAIETAVSSLPQQQQRVFRLSRIEGVPNSEIARQLSISVKTVENHLTLALKNLKRVFLVTLFLVTSLSFTL